ncbi:hypothetical protein M9Y10_032891 [Tritrichomonas musculus]|uniref:Uncharacterized protein n=1 Tax=Tritrichomonas musculus TaxID=1915356 RepID=A0ABR2GY37_9EUKA
MIPFANEPEHERNKVSYKAEQFAKKLDVTIPIRFTKEPKLICPFSHGTFFTTNSKLSNAQSIQQQIYSSLRHGKNVDDNPYFLSFGQCESGTESNTFDIYYAKDKLRYTFSTHICGPKATAQEISETKNQINQAFRFLNQVIAKNNLTGDEIYSINDNGDKDTVICRKYNPATKEWGKATTSRRSEFM